ncbi:hypothetical protein H2C43_08085 [Corynebacterium glutamicum]|uniref:Uncharacterized protein n=1 Tax=Corynebacterium glutamicum (strain ATCC 13032 / DSM 20300 / JCM 1318 / BCRC 11384 / CCUG 27702 / LMG 3730 / NBRC 12168 / NCIMB 10025 / NRRL B-2784 / 534) TaxID=196627 RepID=Q8NPP2_CORGL|nr:hypothetical protein [Corynebacterium glutamicum]ARV64124.1 hypothetical protein B7P23_04035 [Corynebacterium glutamicum]AUI01252.1 hypothetical protein CYL77_08945 [Corynebacterium glutamicum]AUI04902.1 hypothetical protein C0I99_12640 [Corynebacterium glutamicum]MBA4570604.1 hypothetical protein [Corynebacterium glutamicum]MBA4573461.1 hypothetical protein [Corynebacterium glutamicum]
MSFKHLYDKTPEMIVHVYCSGPLCDAELEHDRDGWTCPECGTFWVDPSGKGERAQVDTPDDELEGLPVYNLSGEHLYNHHEHPESAEI